MSGRPPIYSVVAYSNTGKTTLLEKLIPELKKHGLRVAVFKHDAHEFQIDKEGKDSWRMTQAGADVCAIASGTKAAIMENRPTDPEKVLKMITDVDIILTEGYKHGPWPKIVLYRKENGKPLAANPSECVAVMTDEPIQTDTPCFDLNDAQSLAGVIIEDMKKRGQ